MNELAEQVVEFRDRCVAFDAGKNWEAKSLATSIYKLVHDGGKKEKSLLGLVGLKEGARFFSTARLPVPDVRGQSGPNQHFIQKTISPPPLVMLAAKNGMWGYAAPLDGSGRRSETKFARWWSETIYRTRTAES